MKNIEDKPDSHPNRLDRNRAILLSRDLLEMNDWVILSCKISSLATKTEPGDAAELVSIAVIGPGQRALMDVLVRPDGAVNSELLKIHGCDPAHAFNAPLFTDLHKILQAGFARTRVICWNPAKVEAILAKLCRQEKLPQLQATYLDLQAEFSNFSGQKTDSASGYKQQSLPPQSDSDCPGVTPLSECNFLLTLLHDIAASSQSSDAATFNKNWSAAFYKPKLGPAQKIKEILGLSE